METKVMSRGALWAEAFGLQHDALAAQRERYERLKQHMVFQIDAEGMTDPLTGAKDSSWTQYYTDESLLEEINTDLDRLYPAGNESFFQNDLYMTTLRHVLFVWCRLHPDVAYRQGMHDVVAVVLYAFLQPAQRENSEVLELPGHAEADTFLVFEAVMLFLKPFYEIVKNDSGNGLYGQPLEGAERKQPALHRLNKKAFGRYVIMDARSQLAAVGNKAMGKGTEITSNYRGAKLTFMNVENIHAAGFATCGWS
ncbi:Alpha-1,3-mannosyltransferase [Phytophthora palmivora]|uniref:Alpha-1,3-mannosyltransferase n=1 Tax=Phytophthora palmivora TaxID=4796 RepID=A0A2P4YKK8_9STRA|nr:Alpha-1,3-mannosyltransferase [Phytophthora palmivora]